MLLAEILFLPRGRLQPNAYSCEHRIFSKTNALFSLRANSLHRLSKFTQRRRLY